jgi:hypothetical protein
MQSVNNVVLLLSSFYLPELLGKSQFCNDTYWYMTCCISQQSVVFNVHGSVHLKKILIYIHQNATLHSLFYLETALHISGGTNTHHQERIQLYLHHLLFVTLLLLHVAVAVDRSNWKILKSYRNKHKTTEHARVTE